MAQREQEEDDFDRDAEIEYLIGLGFEQPLPIVERIMHVFSVSRAVGWDGARDLCDDTFVGWECDALALGMAVLGEASREEDALRHRAMIAREIGGRRG